MDVSVKSEVVRICLKFEKFMYVDVTESIFRHFEIPIDCMYLVSKEEFWRKNYVISFSDMSSAVITLSQQFADLGSK
jgi:5-enolpyruvylshikimate-3-phosphate synthase